jgi:hypothetical protein
VDFKEIEEKKTRMTMERAREGSDDNLIPFFSDALGDAEAGGIEADDSQVSEAFGIPCMLRRPALSASILPLCDNSVERPLRHV